MQANFTKLAQIILGSLPVYAEEGGEYSEVTFDDLLAEVVADPGLLISEREARMGMECVLSVLSMLSLLEQSTLKKGRIRLVSFPAWIVAKSILSILGDPDQNLFPPTFWSVDNVADHRIEEQRAFLRSLEEQRLENHVKNKAMPFRFIYVAWGLIKLDRKFLLYKREDTKKRVESRAGNYVLVGGRTNLEDIRKMGLERDPLDVINRPESEEMCQAAALTLRRELLEEVNLDFQKEHYTYESWLTLDPFEQIQGARSNHALTRYHIQVFFIHLTPAGYFYLIENMPEDDQVLWFSSDEIAKGQTKTGQTAYLSALHNNFQGKQKTLVNELDNLEDSSPETAIDKIVNDNVLELSSSAKTKCLYGKLGKGKSIDLKLEEDTHNLLLLLAAHKRGIQIVPTQINEILLLQRGWIKLIESEILSVGRKLLDLSEKSSVGFKIENLDQFYFRISTVPEQIFFQPDFYSYQIADKDNFAGKREIILDRKQINTPWGTIASDSITTEITETLAGNIRGNQAGLKDNYRKSSMLEDVRKIALRDFVIREGEIPVKRMA